MQGRSGGQAWDAATAIPYLLTANHRIDDQADASSLVACFDYRSATCDGAASDLVESACGLTCP